MSLDFSELQFLNLKEKMAFGGKTELVCSSVFFIQSVKIIISVPSDLQSSCEEKVR